MFPEKPPKPQRLQKQPTQLMFPEKLPKPQLLQKPPTQPMFPEKPLTQPMSPEKPPKPQRLQKQLLQPILIPHQKIAAEIQPWMVRSTSLTQFC